MNNLEKILESKADYRGRLARRPIEEKLRILEELAERAWAIRNRRSRAEAEKSLRRG